MLVFALNSLLQLLGFSAGFGQVKEERRRKYRVTHDLPEPALPFKQEAGAPAPRLSARER